MHSASLHWAKFWSFLTSFERLQLNRQQKNDMYLLNNLSLLLQEMSLVSTNSRVLTVGAMFLACVVCAPKSKKDCKAGYRWDTFLR